MKRNLSLPLAASLLLLTWISGVVFGYYLTPQFQSDISNNTSMDLGPADRWLDQRYLNAMITHHQGAIELATVAKKHSQRREILELSAAIITSEPQLIEELYAWKKEWYRDRRQAPLPPTVNLGQYDEQFDLRFLNALIAHHRSGIAMTQEVRSKSSRAEVLNNADAVESFLSTSLSTLEKWRREWYGIN